MAGSPPNLDDGELWLPSDIFFPDEAPTNFNPSCLLFKDGHHLSRRFAPRVLLHPSPTPTSERIRAQTGSGGVNGGVCLDQSLIFPVTGGATGAHLAPQPPFFQLLPRPRIERVMGPWPCGALQARFRSSRRGHPGISGLMRGSAGTGVFLPHPRVVSGASSKSAVTDAKKKKQGLGWNKQEDLVSGEKCALFRGGPGKPEDSRCHQLPPMMGLPAP